MLHVSSKISCDSCGSCVSFQFASHPGFHVTYLYPERDPLLLCAPKLLFFTHWHICLSGSGSFPVPSAAPYARDPREHTGHVWVPAEVRNTSPGGQSHEKWQETTGSVSGDQEVTRPIKTRNNFSILEEHRKICRVCSTPSRRHHHPQ